jgi:hypothetical protein
MAMLLRMRPLFVSGGNRFIDQYQPMEGSRPMTIDWKDLAHYGGAIALMLLGAIGSMGARIPGVTIDPATCMAAGVGILAAGLKGQAKS